MKQQRHQSGDVLSRQVASRSIRDWVIIYGPVLLLTIAGFMVAWHFVQPAPPRDLVMATGSPDSAYHQFGLQYQEILARHGVELELVNTAGSVENLALLMDPDSAVDVAFLQGGTGTESDGPDLMGLASLFYEPLWIFSRVPIALTVRDLEGRRVAIGEPGSGTQAAIQRLIAVNDLPLTAFNVQELGGNAAVDALLDGRVDVACFVGAMRAPYIQRLLLSDEIRLSTFYRADAYSRLNRSLSSVVLPRGTADLKRDFPPGDVTMLAPVASLAAKKKLHSALTVVLLEAAEEIHSGGGIFEEPGEFPSVFNTVFPVNEDARRYLEDGPPLLQRYLPFWMAVSVDRLLILLIPLATLLIPLFKIAPPTYRWRIRKRIYSHYQYLFEVESALLEDPSMAELDRCLDQFKQIEAELGEVHVPLSYADQLYHLRMHVRFVKQRVALAREERALAG